VDDNTTTPPATTPARAPDVRPTRLTPPGDSEGDFVVHGRRPNALIFDDQAGVIWTGFEGAQRAEEPPDQATPDAQPNDQTPPPTGPTTP
jgi:hypothetical protein